MSRCQTIIAAALILAASLPARGLEAGKSAADLKLKDQFGKLWSLSEMKGSVVVVVAANPDSGRAMGPWVDNLKARYGDKIRLVGLMDLHGVPFFGRGIAKSRIRKETSDPLMLDFGGGTAKAYEVNDKTPVVVVIDKAGVVRSVQKSAHTPADFDATAGAIDEALRAQGAG